MGGKFDARYLAKSATDVSVMEEAFKRVEGVVSTNGPSGVTVTVKRAGYNEFEIEPWLETVVYEITAPKKIQRMSVDSLAMNVVLPNPKEKDAPFEYRFLYKKRA